jgi:uncharacterized protein (DUF885 family)
MKKLFSFAGIICLIALISCNMNNTTNTNTNAGQNEKFASYREIFLDQLWKLNPSFATEEGYHNYDSMIEIPTPEIMQQKLAAYKTLQDSLHTFDLQQLSDSDKTDYYLIDNYFNSSKWNADTFKQWQWDPSSYNVGEDFDLIASRKDIPLNEKLIIISKRLSYVPAYFDAAKKNISNPTDIHTDLAINQNKGSLDIFNNIADSLKVSTVSDERKQEIQTNLTNAIAAVNDYVKFLMDTVQPDFKKNPPRSFRIGKELYERKFNCDIQSKYTAEELYKIAEQHKNLLHRKMYDLSVKLWSKYMDNAPQPKDSLALIQDVINKIALNHCKKDSFVSTIKEQIPVIEKFINDHHLVYMDPKKPLVVRKTPDYMEGGGTGASINVPGPYDKNGNTFYNVSPPTKMSDADAESFLREYNYYTLQILSIHEAVPGHYVQLMHANMQPSIIKSVFGNTSMIEGWAVYGERMMIENGYGDNSPEMWLMYYKWNLRETLNTILDYSVHCLDMSEDDVMNLLMKEGFQEKTEATNKWKRVRQTQVQLDAYFNGSTEILDLREQYKKALGDKYNLYDFNNKFLSYGSVPVKYISDMMLKDIESVEIRTK